MLMPSLLTMLQAHWIGTSSTYLQRIKDKFLEATDWLAETIVDLETNNKEARICEFENLIEDVQRKVNDNQKAVKQKMERILSQALTNAPLTPAEEKISKMREERVKIRKDCRGEE